MGDCLGAASIIVVMAAIVFFRGTAGMSQPFSWQRGVGDAGDESFTGSGPRPAMTPSPRPERSPEGRVGFAAIRESDPDFDVDGFYSRVDEMFRELQEAALRRDLAPAAHYIDGLAFKGLQARLSAQPRSATAPRLTVERMRATSVKREADQDVVRVMVTAVSDTTGSDPITGAPLTEGPAIRWYAQEYWTLVRTVGARTLPDASIHRCPNCGGPITTSTRAECGYCSTRLCDPNRDWVVSGIAGE